MNWEVTPASVIAFVALLFSFYTHTRTAKELERAKQQLKDFPLHRHTKGNTIYPVGQRPEDTP